MELKMINGKRGQEEIVGFLLVIIMVIVIGLALLFFSKPANVETRDYQVENLLQSIIGTSYNGQTIGARIEACEQDHGCQELGQGIGEIRTAVFTKSGLVVGQNLRGYALNISGGVEYYVKEGQTGGLSRGSATVVRNSLVRLTFYY